MSKFSSCCLFFCKKNLEDARNDVSLALKDALKLTVLSTKVKDYLFSTLCMFSFLTLYVKKYSLTIVYDEDKEEISSIKQKIVDLEPKTATKQISVQMNNQFVENLPSLKQEVVNVLFSAADDAGGLMGDA